MAGPINRRAEEMWSYILPCLEDFASLSVNLKKEPMLSGMSIVDLGSGYGDFVVRLLKEGAKKVIAVDNSMDNLRIVREKVHELGYDHESRLRLVYANLNSKVDQAGIFMPPAFSGFRSPDIAICTSVLPYIEVPDDLLYLMASTCMLSIIECQYSGDGPGFSWIKDDHDMERWLLHYYSYVNIIGRTKLDIRNASRTIWACEGAAK